MKKLWLLASIGVVAACLAAFSFYQINRTSSEELYGTVVDSKPVVGEIELTNGDGERVKLSDYRGEVLLVFFGFTNCPDVCPLTMGRLAKMYEDMGEPDDVQVAMITVDPAHDTPQVLANYVENFNPDFVGLGGSQEDIANAAKTFFVGYQGIADKQFMHTDTVALLDREGRMRLVYGQDKVQHIEDDLKTVLAQRDF